MPSLNSTAMSRAEMFEAVRAADASDPVSLTVRDLIAWWGAKGRGAYVIEEIDKDLARAGIRTEPSFEYGPLDSVVRLTFEGYGELPDTEASDLVAEPSSENQEHETLSVGKIESSLAGVLGISHKDSLQTAQTIMIQNDFSQLPVLDEAGRAVGIVSWESVAKQVIRGVAPTLAQCITRVETLLVDDDLLSSIPLIIRSGAVLVRDENEKITGIITTADLSLRFELMASPFLLIGECEQHIRRLIGAKFTIQELQAKTRTGKRGNLTGVGDLTFGEYQHLLKDEDHWERMKWDLDRELFFDWLDDVRKLRNEVAHFSQDGVDEERLRKVRSLTAWLKASA